ncbi:MAG: sigma-70 family RNA polymerase sigma factor [Clostridia bacterium]|nr:sigma-70 family RNA polymerase sigma factor [Clostridia bacterium]
MEEDYKRRLEEVYRTYYPQYIRYAEHMLYTRTGSKDQAEDFVHQAFLRAVEKEEKSKLHPEQWIMVTLRFCLLNHFKKYSTRLPILKKLHDKQDTSEPSFAPSSDTLIALQQELPYEDYKLIYDYTVRGKTVQELSAETGIDPSYIYVRIHRIRKIAEKIFFVFVVIIFLAQEV